MVAESDYVLDQWNCYCGIPLSTCNSVLTSFKSDMNAIVNGKGDSFIIGPLHVCFAECIHVLHTFW